MNFALASLGILGTIFAPQSVQMTTYGGFSMSQTIDMPSAQVGFVDSDNQLISSPAINFPNLPSSLKCLTYGDGAPMAYLGTDEQQIFVSVPNTYNGWGLSIIDGGEWESSNSQATMSLNDGYANGCLPNPADTYRINSKGGLMYVDPRTAVLTNDCLYSCEDSNIEIGTFDNFANSENFTLPLVFNLEPNNGWQGKISNIELTQTIPANVPPASYSTSMTLSLQLL